MDFKDVILTASESANLAAKHLEKYKCLDTFTRERDKAQCLKLLEWGRIHCQEHYPSLEYIDDCPRRFDCPSCMVIIEKLLKDNNND
jgi:hypothetical protein